MKIYAKQIPLDIQESPFSIEEDDYYNHISIFRNKHFAPIIKEPVLTARRIVNDDELEDIIERIQKLTKNKNTEKDRTNRERHEIINDLNSLLNIDPYFATYFVSHPAENIVQKLEAVFRVYPNYDPSPDYRDPVTSSPHNSNRIYHPNHPSPSLYPYPPHRYPGTNSTGELENIVWCLNLITPYTSWTYDTLRGSSQSEWNDVIYPSEIYNRNDIKTLGIYYWNEGTEWIISEPYEDNTIIQDEDKIDFQIGYYSTNYDIDEIRKEIADVSGCDSKDVILFEFINYKKIPIYQIRES